MQEAQNSSAAPATLFPRENLIQTAHLIPHAELLLLEDAGHGLAAGFTEVFVEQLGKAGYPVVEETGPDVLILRPALVNVDVTAPDTNSGLGSRTYVRTAGSMTLYLELYDSSTRMLLARVIDPQADDDSFVREADRMNNQIAAERILKHWATLLTNSLEAVHAGN